MATNKAKLKPGTRVTFTAASGNSTRGPALTIASHEQHNGETFYRLREKLGGLWLRSSLHAQL